MDRFKLMLSLLVLWCAGSSGGFAAGERIALRAEMFQSESQYGEPGMLADEQDLTSGPLPVKPKSCWGSSRKGTTYPMACTLDLGRERDLGTLWLFDKYSAGRFRVQAGEPGRWRDVVVEDLHSYDQWKEHRLAERTRWLRFVKEEGAANVAEIALFERSRPDMAVTAPRLVDEILCGEEIAPGSAHDYAEFPAGAARVETILGRRSRVMGNESGGMKYFAYRLGAGKGLKAGGAYVLEVDYPEDAPRTMFIMNRGCEESLGFHTGPAVGDVLKGRYTFSNAESLKLPLAGEYRTWKTLFFLHDRFPGLVQPRGDGAREELPEGGFRVIVGQLAPEADPPSRGAAVAAIRLYEVPPSFYDVKLPELPEGLPRRHIFCREEMGDGAVSAKDAARRGLTNVTDWYEFKARRMRHLAMDTFCRDLLEFGANQGWDSSPYGGNAWYFMSNGTEWPNILTMLGEYGLNVLPYYEYYGSVGSKGLGSSRPCVTLGGGRRYTHIAWCEKAGCDVTDPRFLEDAHKLLDCTMYRYKDRANFIGAWLRQRPTAMPVSFSDRCLSIFSQDINENWKVTREELKKDATLYGRYRAWWGDKRRDYLRALRDDLRTGTGKKDAFLLFTTDASEPGAAYPDWKRPLVVTDDAPWWSARGISAIGLDRALAEGRHLAALTRDPLTWSWYEWQHAAPSADPERYRDEEGLMLSYTFNRAYTVGAPQALDAFRTRGGLAAVRHYGLNENEMSVKGADGKDEYPLGYFVADVEAAGPFCMMAEALAVANGDPDYLGYLSGRQHNRGFFEFVRDFNLNYLALPALPSKVVAGAAGDPAVVVRAIEAGDRGTWLAVVNTGWQETKDVRVMIGNRGAQCMDAVTGEPIKTETDQQGVHLRLTLRPCQLKALKLI